MRNKVKKKWIEALRSGKYKQGNNTLCLDDKFCCLGVLCDIALESGLEIKIDKSVAGKTVYDGTTNFLPESVMKWAGLETDNPKVKSADEVTHPNGITLSELNDNGEPFGAIADRIEKEL